MEISSQIKSDPRHFCLYDGKELSKIKENKVPTELQIVEFQGIQATNPILFQNYKTCIYYKGLNTPLESEPYPHVHYNIVANLHEFCMQGRDLEQN